MRRQPQVYKRTDTLVPYNTLLRAQQILPRERQVDTVVDAVVVVEIVVVVGQVDAQQQVAPQFPLHFEAGGGLRLRRGARRAGGEIAPRGTAQPGGARRNIPHRLAGEDAVDPAVDRTSCWEGKSVCVRVDI